MDLFFCLDRSYQNRFIRPGWRRSPGVLRFFQVGIPIDPPICRELFPNVLRLGGSAQTVQEIVTLGLSQEAKKQFSCNVHAVDFSMGLYLVFNTYELDLAKYPN